MHAQMFFQDLASSLHAGEAPACFFRAAIVASQICARLFAFENGSGGVRSGAIGRDIGPETTLGQAHLERARGVTLSLRPKKGEAFQPAVRGRFRPAFAYPFVHSTNSRAQ